MRVGWSPRKNSIQAGTDLEQLDFHKVVIVAGELAHRDEAISLEVHALAPPPQDPRGYLLCFRRDLVSKFAITTFMMGAHEL